jgi:hypothetical protein
MDNAERIVDAAIRRLRPGKGNAGAQLQPEAPRPLMREMPPPDPFPVQALGGILADAAIGIQDRTRAPIAICGQSVMAAATLVTQGHANVRLPTTQLRPLSNFFATVAVTGERKTAADTEAIWPIRKREETLRERYGSARQEYENAKEAWDCARNHAMKAGKGNTGAIRAALTQLGPPPNEPLLPLLAVTEPTIEGLVKVFAKGWPSLGVFSDEGGMFIGGHAMKEEARLRTATTLSKLWDGNPIDRIRSGEGAQVLPGRRLAMHLMAQPNVAALFLGDGMLAEQGLLSRVLPTAPESAIGTRMWRQASDESNRAVKDYGKRLLDILELPLTMAAGKQNELAPRELKLSAEARQRWIGFHDHVEQDLKEDGPLWPIRGLGNKIPEIVVRLSGVLALIENATAQEISADVLEQGIALAEHYMAEGLRLFEACQADAELLIWLLRGKEVVALTEATAAIENPNGSITVYRKHQKPALGPLGDALDDLLDPEGALTHSETGHNREGWDQRRLGWALPSKVPS